MSASERCRSELDAVLETLDRTVVAELRCVGRDGLVIEIDYDVRSLYRAASGAIEARAGLVSVMFEMHPDHPHMPPLAVARTPGLWNPHVNDPESPAPHLPPIPLVCLGAFTPQHRLCDWVAATWDLLRWARLSTERTLNPAATEFARSESRTPGRFPVDRRSFWRGEADADVVGAAQRDCAEPSVEGAASPSLKLGASWRTE